MSDAALLLLLIVANGAPIIVERFMGTTWNCPLDAGLRFFDGRPLLGSSKTLRGLCSSIAVTALVAPLVGFGALQGAVLAALSMMGDAVSSFIKRRLGMAPSSMAPGLDQIPESLLPLWFLRAALGLDGWDVARLTAMFFVADLLLSRILFRLRIRKKPY